MMAVSLSVGLFFRFKNIIIIKNNRTKEGMTVEEEE